MSKIQIAAYRKAFQAFADTPTPSQSRKGQPSVLNLDAGLFENQCTVRQTIYSRPETTIESPIREASLETFHIAKLGPVLYGDHREAIAFIYPKIISLAEKGTEKWKSLLLIEKRALKEETGKYYSYLVISKLLPRENTITSQYTRLRPYEGEAYNIQLISTRKTLNSNDIVSLKTIKREYLESLPFTPHQLRVLKGYAIKVTPNDLAKEMKITIRTLDYHRKELLISFKKIFRSERAQSCKSIHDVLGFFKEMDIL